VDGSPNSLPPELLTTNRENVLFVESMTDDLIKEIVEFKKLIKCLERNQLLIPVMNVFGGIPTKYMELLEKLGNLKLLDDETPNTVVFEEVKKFIFDFLIGALAKNIFKSSRNTKNIIEVCKKKKVISIDSVELLREGKLKLDYPNKVFREVLKGEDRSFLNLEIQELD